MSAPPVKAGFLLVEIMLFALASLVHGGWIIKGYGNTRAAIVEALVAAMLGIGFIITLSRPALARRTLLITQLIAVLGLLGALFVM